MVIFSLDESADYIRNIKSLADVLCDCLFAVAQCEPSYIINDTKHIFSSVFPFLHKNPGMS